MKILELRKKIITNSILTASSLALFCACAFYNMHQNSQMNQQAESIANETSQIQSQAQELQSKTMDIKKYMAIWRNLDEKKKNTAGFKIDDVNNSLSAIAIKHNISDPVIKVVSDRDGLNMGVFNCTTINPSLNTVNLSFKALEDSKALSFINEFIESLPGYVVISSFDIKKDKSYTSEDLIAISAGKGSGLVSGNMNFFWYTFKNKSAATSAAKKTN